MGALGRDPHLHWCRQCCQYLSNHSMASFFFLWGYYRVRESRSLYHTHCSKCQGYSCPCQSLAILFYIGQFYKHFFQCQNFLKSWWLPLFFFCQISHCFYAGRFTAEVFTPSLHTSFLSFPKCNCIYEREREREKNREITYIFLVSTSQQLHPSSNQGFVVSHSPQGRILSPRSVS